MSQPKQTPRSEGERRETGEREERARRMEPTAAGGRRRSFERIARDVLTIVMLVAAIGYTATLMRPIYAGRAPGIGQVLRSAALPQTTTDTLAPTLPPGTLANAHTLRDSVAAIEASPEFAEQKRRFAEDLVRTGRMAPARADSVARYAVREAFLRGVPPAVVFGIMLTENAQFISRARSNVGAVGLMQVYPKVWLKSLSKKFGTSNIAADSTNLRYGIYILQTYLKPRAKAPAEEHVVQTAPGSLMKGLLRYNGCVRGTNTPRCHTYPNKVQTYVERDAESLCGNQTFYQCIAKPFMAGLLGRSTE